MSLTYKRVSAYTIGTSRKDFDEKPRRIGLVIQNLSTNTLYFLGYKQNILGINIPANHEYDDEVGASASFSLIASAASTSIVIEEIFQV